MASRKNIDPKDMIYVDFGDGPEDKKYPEATSHFGGSSLPAVPSYYDLCNVFEKLCRRIDLVNLSFWKAPGVPYPDRGSGYVLGIHSDVPAVPAAVAGRPAGLAELFSRAFRNVCFLDPDAPFIGSPDLGMTDSTATGGTGGAYTVVPRDGQAVRGDTVETGRASVALHVLGRHVFPCLWDWYADTELEEVTTPPLPPDRDRDGEPGDARKVEPVRMPVHGLFYRPEGYKSVYPGPDESPDYSSDGYDRACGRHMVGAGWEDVAGGARRCCYRLLGLYPRVRHAFRGLDIGVPYVDGTGWENPNGPNAVAQNALDRWGEGEYSGSLELGGDAVERPVQRDDEDDAGFARRLKAFLEAGHSVDLYPERRYEWNYWDHSSLARRSWGDSEWERGLRRLYRPPCPEGVLALPLYDRDNAWPRDRGRAEGWRERWLDSARRLRELGYDSLADGYEADVAIDRGEVSAAPNVLVNQAPGPEGYLLYGWGAQGRLDSHWMPAFLSPLLVDSLYRWTDLMRWSVVEVPADRLEYSLDLSMSVSAAREDAYGTGDTVRRRTGESEYSLSWRGTGAARFGSQGGDYPPTGGVAFGGAFDARLPCAGHAVGGLHCDRTRDVDDEITYKWTDGNTTKEYPKEHSRQTIELRGKVSALVTRVRPLRSVLYGSYETGPTEASRASWSRAAGEDGRPAVRDRGHARLLPAGGRAPEPLVTPVNMTWMKSCRLYAIVRVEAAEALYVERELDQYGDGGRTERHSTGRANGKRVGYRVVDMGAPLSDGCFEGTFDPVALVEGLGAPAPEGPVDLPGYDRGALFWCGDLPDGVHSYGNANSGA